MLSQLQLPNSQRSAALGELNVQTHDGQGNLLPAENILKAISDSFEKSKLGTAQQTAYLKAIFGQGNAREAGILVSAAGNGTLAEKSQQLQGLMAVPRGWRPFGLITSTAMLASSRRRGAA